MAQVGSRAEVNKASPTAASLLSQILSHTSSMRKLPASAVSGSWQLVLLTLAESKAWEERHRSPWRTAEPTTEACDQRLGGRSSAARRVASITGGGLVAGTGTGSASPGRITKMGDVCVIA